MRESVLAVGVLAFALLACGYRPTGAFSPRSVSTPTDQICKIAIEMGPDDVEQVGEAGGVKTGVLTVDADSNPLDYEVAAVGGTHYIGRRSTNQYTSHGMLSRRHNESTIDVYRVPVRAWDLLPKALRPEKP